MNPLRSIVSLLALVAAGAAQAGSTGAGPAGSAGSAIGSVVNPGSHAVLDTPTQDGRQHRVLPGNAGDVKLTGEQLAKVEAQLRAFKSATALGNTISAPTVLADGTNAVIVLNTRTGVLTVTRQEK